MSSKTQGTDSEWVSRSSRASLASHRLIGWIYWDPGAIERYAALGVPGGTGYYIASRGAPLAPAGNAAVTAAFYSILPAFVEASLDMARTNTTFDRVIDQWCRCTTSGSAPDGAEGAVGRTDEERPVGTAGLVAVDRCAGVDIEEAASIGR